MTEVPKLTATSHHGGPSAWARRLVTTFCLALLSWPVLAIQTSIESVRVRPSPERTRIVFDLSKPVEHKIFSLADPDRLVIDIDNTKLDTTFDGVDLAGTPIKEMRASARDGKDLRVVLDLSDEVRPRSFVLKPIMQYGDRLVIDLYTREQQAPEIRKADRLANQMRDVVVAIDAGHGGDDPGAIGAGHLYEKDVTLAIAKDLNQLVDDEPGFSPLMIRQGDYFLALRERTEIARKNKADVFVSIHADAFRTAEARGASVYALSQQGATSETARWLADSENRADLIGGTGGVSLDDKDDMLAGVLLDLSMTASLSASLEMGKDVLAAIKPVNRLHRHHVEQAGFVVLKSPDIPSILIETGYISNPREATRLSMPSHQKELAEAILTGIRHYINDHPPAGSYLAWKRQGGGEKLEQYHIVRGDTLTGIANKYRVNTDVLRKVNGLNNDTLRIGQVLKIPTS